MKVDGSVGIYVERYVSFETDRSILVEVLRH